MGLTSRLTPRACLVLWVGLIMLAVLPWADFQNHTHWWRMQWVPFVTPPIKVLDVLINLLLYMPFGYWFAEQRPTAGRRVWRAVAAAAAISLATEYTQLYSHSRFPSLTDVTNNVVGAFIGAVLATRKSPAEGRVSQPALR